MKFLVCLVLGCLQLQDCAGYNRNLQFPAEVTLGNVLILEPDFSQVQEEISVCAWLKPYRQDGNRYWFSYAAGALDNEIILSDRTSTTHLFADTLAGSEVVPLNEWSHMCLTWSSVSQVKQFYLDGSLVSSETTPTGRKITTGGTLVLGQEQDSPGGGFSIGQAFGGEVHDLNVLKKALSGGDIGRIYRAGLCFEMEQSSYADSIVLGWEEVFLQADIQGQVKVVTGDCDKWDILSDFVGQEITSGFIEYLKKYYRD